MGSGGRGCDDVMEHFSLSSHKLSICPLTVPSPYLLGFMILSPLLPDLIHSPASPPMTEQNIKPSSNDIGLQSAVKYQKYNSSRSQSQLTILNFCFDTQVNIGARW